MGSTEKPCFCACADGFAWLSFPSLSLGLWPQRSPGLSSNAFGYQMASLSLMNLKVRLRARPVRGLSVKPLAVGEQFLP